MASLKKAAAMMLAAGMSAAVANGQVVINEVWENPPGSASFSDAVWEYIELYGRPGMDLTGYAIALLKGGSDSDGDDIPDGGSERFAEIDEAYSLDGLSLGANGILILYQTDEFGFSQIIDRGLIDPMSNSAELSAIHIPTTDTPGNLANDNSSSYVLVRRRPNHSIDPMTGMSVYGPGYAWRKDINPDVNFDGMVDCGTEPQVGAPGQAPLIMEAYQMVDDVAWSNAGGKEYVRDSEQEISNTDGFNPDAISRIAYYLENPMLGHRFNSDGVVVNTRSADEEWIYGEIISTGGSTALQYNNVLDAMGFRQVKGPTDPSGPTYDGTCNPDDPMSGCTPAPGPFLFQDLNLAGFRVTPGQFNDVDGTGSGGIVINQFRFVAGDFDFDGDADAEDYRLICAALGAGLDDQEMRPCPGDPNVMINAYVYEGRALNQLLAMAAQDETDGIGGANADEVTDQDAATHRVLIGAGVAPDLNGDGIINASDLGTLLGSWGSDNALADYNKDGVVNAADLSTLLGSWGQH